MAQKNLMKIVRAKIVPGSLRLGDANFGRNTVLVELEDGREEVAFRYYMDELSFNEAEFEGLTLEEARALHRERDIAYLRS